MKTLVLGMGNELLSDDAVGLKVVRELGQAISHPDLEVRETCLASVELLDLLAGFDRAIIVDAIKTGAGKPGDIYILSPDDFGDGSAPASLHHVDLPTVLAAGRSLGAKMPDDVRIFAVEAKDTSTFGGECCPAVQAAVPRVIRLIRAELGRTGVTPSDARRAVETTATSTQSRPSPTRS